MAGLVEHVVSVIATRDREDRPAYRAVCSCRYRGTPRLLKDRALAENDKAEHERYRQDVARLTAPGRAGAATRAEG